MYTCFKCDGDSLILQPVNPPHPDLVPDWVMVRFQAEALLTSEMMRGAGAPRGPLGALLPAVLGEDVTSYHLCDEGRDKVKYSQRNAPSDF